MFIVILLTLLFKMRNISANSDQSENSTMTVPPLIKEQPTTHLVSDPELTPTWVRPERNNLNITENIRKNQGQYSTPTSSPAGVTMTVETMTLNVTYPKGLGITKEATVKKGHVLDLTCIVDSRPLSLMSWKKEGFNTTMVNGTGTSRHAILTAENTELFLCTEIHLNNNRTETVDVVVKHAEKQEITGETAVTGGDALRLTCTVDRFLPFAVTWNKLGFNTTMINGTGAVRLVIFNVTAEHSGQYICTAKLLNDNITEKVSITVKYAKKPEITGKTTVTEGDALNLTCTVDCFFPSVIMWTKHGKNRTLISETGPDNRSSTLVIHNVTAEHSGQYFCTAKCLSILTQDVNITVLYWRSHEITGEGAVVEGHVLNLTCNTESWPPSVVTWNKLGINTTFNNGTGAARLIIFNVTAEHSGQYVCTAKHQSYTHKATADIRVQMLPKILNNSECEAQSDILTCVCISQGSPLPTIKWPLLENHNEYLLNAAVSNHTVKSTIILTVKNQSSSSAMCVSSNENGKTERNLSINKVEKKDQVINIIRDATLLGMILSFLVGILFSFVIFYLVSLCYRKKIKSSGNLGETLEMMNNGQSVEYAQVTAKGTAGGAEAATADVDYSDIDFLVLKREIPAKASQKSKSSGAEYAEIKKGKKDNKRQDGESKEGEELKNCVLEERESEDVAVYSNVTDLMAEI